MVKKKKKHSLSFILENNVFSLCNLQNKSDYKLNQKLDFGKMLPKQSGTDTSLKIWFKL